MANVGAFVQRFYIITRGIQQAGGVCYSRLALIGNTYFKPNMLANAHCPAYKQVCSQAQVRLKAQSSVELRTYDCIMVKLHVYSRRKAHNKLYCVHKEEGKQGGVFTGN